MKNKTGEPIIVTADIETYPSKVLMYGNTWDAIVVKILTFQSILSFSYKINNGKTKYIGLNTIKGYKKGDLNDKKLLIEISKVLQGIDYFAGQNSDNFDIKIINERLMFHKLPPLPDNIGTLDTKKLYKKVSRLPNNKLDTIGLFNGIGQKLEHNGVDLFIKCGEGEEKAWKLNRRYNMRDVDLTYDILQRVLPYTKLANQQKVFSENIQCSNPLCLSFDLIKAKRRRVTNGWKQQYQCKACGKYTQSRKLIKDK